MMMISITNGRRRLPKSRRLLDSRLFPQESALRAEYRQRLADAMERERLSLVTGVTDQGLLGRLVDAGFTSETISALSVLPIAFAAWGSGVITAREKSIAEEAVGLPELSGKAEAIHLYRTWLRQRPTAGHWHLWRDFTLARLAVVQSSEREQAGRRLMRLASRVAEASGGFLGIGRTCVNEHNVLDRIRFVYSLE
jgi:hypothetical protein